MESACDESISRTRVMSKRVSANKPESYVVKAATQSNSHNTETMPSEIAFIQSPTSSCNLESPAISSALPSHELMSRSWS
jgi:hypothetical protein